jgi:hypothetical protein
MAVLGRKWPISSPHRIASILFWIAWSQAFIYNLTALSAISQLNVKVCK